jgi:LPS-assembly lipoprotein
MSLSDRRSFLILLAIAPLAACGFAPVYGPGGGGHALRGQVTVTAPATRQGFMLVARLEDRLGRSTAPTLRLDWDTATTERGLAITGSNDITRINLTGTLNFRLTQIATEQTVQTGAVSSFTAYSTTGSPLATAAARRDAEDRLMVALADQLISRLLSGAADRA